MNDGTPPEAVGKDAEAQITSQRAELHRDDPAGRFDQAQPYAAFFDRSGEIVGHPGEESPIGEHHGRTERNGQQQILQHLGPEHDRREGRRPRRRTCDQRAGSATSLRIQKTSSAGKTPAAKSHRHPKRGMTIAETIAARMYPTAQPDCMMPMALPRWAAGQLSLTSTAPAAHSPPMPRPSSARQTINCVTLPAVAVPSEQKE